MRTHTQLKIFLVRVLIGLATLTTVTAHAQGQRQAASSNPGSLSFLPVVTYDPGGPQAAMVVVADVNGDGKPDLIVLNCGNCYGPPSITNPGSVGIMLGHGDGTFQKAVTYGTGTASPRFVVVADVNGDGKPDLVVANRCIDAGCLIEAVVAVLLGNGDGTFQTAVAYNSGGLFAGAVAVADVNGDSKPDLIVGNWCSDPNCDGSIGILLGNGNGTFQPVVTYATGGLYAFAVAVEDVNADGKPDVLVITDVPVCSGGTCSFPPAAAVLLGNGDGTFRTSVTYPVGGFDDPPLSSMLAVADVNDDGKLDLIVESSQCCGSAHGVVGVLLGKGDGTFKPVVRYQSAAGGQGSSVAVADVQGDGKRDIVTTDHDAGANGLNKGLVSLRLGNGDGTFNAEQTYDSGGFLTNSVAVADINGDGKPDLVVANICADDASLCKRSSVGVLLNNTTLSKFTTSTSFTSSLNPSTYGQKVTWTATVKSSGSVTPTGTVRFKWQYFTETFTIGTAILNSNGVATFSRSNLNAYVYPMTAVYAGDAANQRSTSVVLNQVVLETTSLATLTSSPNPSTQGQAVTFTAKISSPTVRATGPVTFTAGKKVLGTGQLSSGKATLTISSLAVGLTKITATYYGDSNIAKSSASVIQTVH